jgi:4'-phosphopantetheinyl transferase EntD
MILQVEAISETTDVLLSQLERKAWYLPSLSAMSAHRQREWLTVRSMLKKATGEEKQILYTTSGKPYLADASYHIGISHTKGYAAVALDKRHPITVDIERISPRVEKIRSRFMSLDEEQHLSAAHPLLHLLLHWSAKESLFKYMDEDDIEFRTQLHIHPFQPTIGAWSECGAHETRTAGRQQFTIRYLVKEDYVLTLATAAEATSV